MGKHNIDTEYNNKQKQIRIEKTTLKQRPNQFLELSHLATVMGNTDNRFPEQDYTTYSYGSDALGVPAR